MLKTNDARLPETDRHDDIRRETVGLSAGGQMATAVGTDDDPLVAGLFNNPYAAGTAQM